MTDSELMQLSEQGWAGAESPWRNRNNCRVLYRWLGSESDYRYCR